jgi:hypothetical protein
LLLGLGNFVQSIATDYALLSQPTESQLNLEWGSEARLAILAAPAEQRRDLLVQYLWEGLCRWLEADWALQDWWMRILKPKAWASDSFEVPLGPKLVAQLRQGNKSESPNRPPLPSFIHESPRQFNGNITLDLPSFYLEILVAVRSAFEPWLNFPHFEKATKTIDLGFLDIAPWKQAILMYKNAVESLRQFSRENGLRELEMYRQISCLPFGQHFKTSIIHRLQAATSKVKRSVAWRGF